MSGTPLMYAAHDNAARKGLRGWWAFPPRPGMQRLINPWEYRHLRAFGITRIAGGLVAATAGVVCLSYAAYLDLALSTRAPGWPGRGYVRLGWENAGC